jgi:hypothetical protein
MLALPAALGGRCRRDVRRRRARKSEQTEGAATMAVTRPAKIHRAAAHLGCGRAQRSSAVRRSDTARTGNRSVRFRKWNRRRRPPDVSISRMVQSREDRSRHIRALALTAALASGGALDPELRVSLNFHPDPLVHGLLSSKRSPGTVCTGHSSKQELVTVGLPRILTETAGSGSSGVRDDGVGRQS